MPQDLEKALDVFNIILVRQQAQAEVCSTQFFSYIFHKCETVKKTNPGVKLCTMSLGILKSFQTAESELLSHTVKVVSLPGF